MILPDYDHAPSSPEPSSAHHEQGAFDMWNNANGSAGASSMQFHRPQQQHQPNQYQPSQQQHQQPNYFHQPQSSYNSSGSGGVDYGNFVAGPITPNTPIIYGNGTMLSDIGEVTEVESLAGGPVGGDVEIR